MVTLDDFRGGESERPDPPVVNKRGRILVPCGERTREAGVWGPSNRTNGDLRAYVTERDRREHDVYSYDAYAISDSVLDKCRRLGVKVVFIAETNTGTVYEYTFADWWKFGDAMPEPFLQDSDDPQTYVPRESAKYIWSDRVNALIEDRGGVRG